MLEIIRTKNSITMLDNDLEAFSQAKLTSKGLKTALQSILAGFFIGIGASLFIIILNLSTNHITKLIASISFSIGLLLIFKFKSQLFTGNHLILFSMFRKTTRPRYIFKNWIYVFLGNFLGAVLLAVILGFTIYQLDLTSLIDLSFKISYKKLHSPWDVLLLKAVACNILVCIAVYFGIRFKEGFKYYLGIIIPISLFVFLGFEHSIANMFFLSLDSALSLFATKAIHLNQIDLFVFHNLVFVTLGNLIGGALVSLVLYLASKPKLI